ncbi:MAG: hypothetical protein ABJB76_12770 [Candidatus Nitrosocosmicus sp.]
MNKSKYKCLTCSKKFSRKYNAQRYNDTVHKDSAFISYPLNRMITPNKQSKIKHPGSTISKFKEFGHNLENNMYSPSYSTFKLFNNLHQKKSSKSVILMNEDEKENLLYNKLEKIITPFEKLEKLFVEAPYLIHPYKNIDAILSTIIIEALKKPDPDKVVHNYLAHYNKLYFRNKMILYVARSRVMNAFYAIEYLKRYIMRQEFVDRPRFLILSGRNNHIRRDP